MISIHALREEGDFEIIYGILLIVQFLSTPSARRATRTTAFRTTTTPNFYPRPPRGGRPLCGVLGFHGLGISIHALREEGDEQAAAENDGFEISIHALREEGDVDCIHFLPVDDISIHALREEGDATIFGSFWSASGFLSTPSARRATCRSGLWTLLQVISIHALREEGDLGAQLLHILAHDFYPRPPRGGRLPALVTRLPRPEFLSTPSARRATGP